jgi:hypothetical protein
MKAKRSRTPEQREEDRRRGERVDRMLRERIAYHDAKLREERPGWAPPQTTEGWQAYCEAKWAAERAGRSEAG